MSEVKPGQVWQNKNMGSQWTTCESPDVKGGRKWWALRRVGADGTKSVPEWMLVDDYVLVKEAP